MSVVGYAPGVYDLFHVGHLNALRFARQYCDVLVAGVVSDEVHAEVTADKLDSWKAVRFHRLFKGDDWRGTQKGDALEARMAPLGVEITYFPYTLHTSSTRLRRDIVESTTRAAGQ